MDSRRRIWFVRCTPQIRRAEPVCRSGFSTRRGQRPQERRRQPANPQRKMSRPRDTGDARDDVLCHKSNPPKNVASGADQDRGAIGENTVPIQSRVIASAGGESGGAIRNFSAGNQTRIIKTSIARRLVLVRDCLHGRIMRRRAVDGRRPRVRKATVGRIHFAGQKSGNFSSARPRGVLSSQTWSKSRVMGWARGGRTLLIGCKGDWRLNREIGSA